MEELEALLRDLESPGTPRDPPRPPRSPPGTPPGQGPGGDPEQLYSSVRKPRPPPGAPPPPGLGELERLLRDLSEPRSGPEGELLAQPPQDGTGTGGSPPLRDSGTPPGPPKFGEGAPKSAATAELDRLLASLADFHLQPKGPPKPPAGAGQELEALLELLQVELRGRGVPTGQRGHCRGCGEPLQGQAVQALGSPWHRGCFRCASCGAALGPGGFLGRAGVPLCPPCGAPRCQRCQQPVLGAVVTALGQTWHPEHFCCSHCGEVLGDEGFLERGGLPFCRRDFGALFGGRCRRCGDPVLEAFVAALGGLWHPQCFVCQDCGCSFPGGSFCQRGGAPVCRRHFREPEGAGPGWGRS